MTESTPVDARIPLYREAAVGFQRGHFHPAIEGGDDEVGQLGRAMVDLGEYLEDRYEEIETLSTITAEMNRGVLLEEVLEHVYRSFRPMIPYDRIGFALLNPDGSKLTAHWARSESERVMITKGYSASMEGSSLQTILATGEPRILNDLEGYLADHPHSHSTRMIVEEGMRSSLTCPLMSPDGPLGFMFFSSMTPGTYRDVHVAVFRQIAGQLAGILQKSRLYENLLRLNQMKDRLIGMAAHDLRNPVTAILGFAEFLQSDAVSSETERAELVGWIVTEAELMRDILSDVLDVASIQTSDVPMQRAPTDVAVVLEERARANRIIALGKEQTLTCDIASDLPLVDGDARRLGQVVDNLLSNAIKYTEPGGSIEMRAYAEKGGAVIEVEDSGQGIAADELPAIFDEFAKTSSRPTGGERSTGLGLAIVKRVVEAHGGTVSVASELGKGSVFTVWLPGS